MIKQPGLALFLSCSLLMCIWGPTSVCQDKPQQEKPHEDNVVRVTTNLVQLDVTVTDKDGQQVADLKPEDFEVREENRTQEITNFSYIAVSPAPAIDIASVTTSGGATRNTPPPPSTRLRADQVRRTLAVLVDDASMSFREISTFLRQRSPTSACS